MQFDTLDEVYQALAREELDAGQQVSVSGTTYRVAKQGRTGWTLDVVESNLPQVNIRQSDGILDLCSLEQTKRLTDAEEGQVVRIRQAFEVKEYKGGKHLWRFQGPVENVKGEFKWLNDVKMEELDFGDVILVEQLFQMVEDDYGFLTPERFLRPGEEMTEREKLTRDLALKYSRNPEKRRMYQARETNTRKRNESTVLYKVRGRGQLELVTEPVEGTFPLFLTLDEAREKALPGNLVRVQREPIRIKPEDARELVSLWPVRCITCGTVIGQRQLKYEELIQDGIHPCEALTAIGLSRPCCRSVGINPPVGQMRSDDAFILVP